MNVEINGMSRSAAKGSASVEIKKNQKLLEAVQSLIDAMPEGDNVQVRISGDFADDGVVRERSGTITVTTGGKTVVKEEDTRFQRATNDDGERTDINARVTDGRIFPSPAGLR